MACTVTMPWDDAMLGYDFGPGHPMAPVRIALTRALADELGVLSRVSAPVPAPASDDELRAVHTAPYVEAVKIAGHTLRPDPAHGLGTPDDPVFPDMHEASALVTGATLAAIRAVHAGDSDHGVNLSGGLHHAMPDRASGFCVYDDPAVAIAWLLGQGVERIAYVDVDVHHGDGVQAMFWDEPRVLTVSLHESGRTLFPGSGFPTDVGGPRARGRAVNVALPAGTGDVGWHAAFEAVVPPLLRAFAPTYLVTQHGCDSHASDPLANLRLSVDGQRRAHAALHALAHEVCDGRWLAVGGGGYDVGSVVPRSWTHLLAESLGDPVDPGTATPVAWRSLVAERAGVRAPETMTDAGSPWSSVNRASGDSPPGESGVSDAVAATKAAVFAHHGLPA